MGNNPADNVFPRPERPQTPSSSRESARRRSARARMPSSANYLIIAGTVAVGLFLALWWMFVGGGDEAWVPAGLAASVVFLVALSAREVVMRRAWTRYLLEQDKHEQPTREANRNSGSSRNMHSASAHSASLRAIQKQSAETEGANASPESHLEVFQLCQDYLSNTDEALRSNSLSAEIRLAIRSGQEKVRNLQRRHLLIWARDGSRALTHEAQLRARTSDKLETANRALDCLDSALKVYPNEPELEESKLAIREFIASIKVAHWVELAERSAFKGHHRRAIERYNDALFYLNRETVKEDLRAAGAERILREIALLRAHVSTTVRDEPVASPRERRTGTVTDPE